MDDESGESMEPMEEVPLIQLGETELVDTLCLRLRCSIHLQLLCLRCSLFALYSAAAVVAMKPLLL